MSAISVFHQFYPELVASLPMKDDVFIDMLEKKGLSSGANWKERLQLHLVSAQAACYFLDQMIEPGLQIGNASAVSFEKMLSVMEEFNSDMVNQLATRIRLALKGESETSATGGHSLGNLPNTTDMAILLQFYVELVASLPMKDDVFIDMLEKKGLFYGNLRARLQRKPKSADAASFFLDNVLILQGKWVHTESFEKLLAVMEEFSSPPLKNLAGRIKQKLNATTEEKGQSQEKMSATEEFDEKMTSAQEKDFEEDCKTAKQKLLKQYGNLLQLNFNSIIAPLFACGVIRLHGKNMIESYATESERASYFLDNVLFRSVSCGTMDEYTKFVEVLRQKGEEGDAVFEKVANDLSI